MERLSSQQTEIHMNGTITSSKETPKPESKPKAESKPKTESKPKAKEPVATNNCIDINSANKEQLQGIIHIGPEQADLVIQGRPYSSVEGLTSVKGIAAGRLADIVTEGKACVR
jgi:DNA uptake protein ComE-like DNA-binding protein